jgi:hypothetical protein
MEVVHADESNKNEVNGDGVALWLWDAKVDLFDEVVQQAAALVRAQSWFHDDKVLVGRVIFRRAVRGMRRSGSNGGGSWSERGLEKFVSFFAHQSLLCQFT